MQPQAGPQPIFIGTPQVQTQPIQQQSQSPYAEQPQQPISVGDTTQGHGTQANYDTHQLVTTRKVDLSNGPAVAALVFALISIPSTFFGTWIDICMVTSGLALTCVIILGVFGLTKNKRQHGGVVVAIIGLIVGIIQIVFLVLARMEGN